MDKPQDSLQCHYCNYSSDDEYLCDPAGSNICEPCTQLMELEKKIKSIRLMLTGLESDRHKLKIQANQHHDKLVDRLPPEIIAEVFEMCTTREFMDFIGYPSKYMVSAPLVISAVCRSWRKIAFSAPRLWQILILHETRWHGYDRPMLPSPILVQEWVERSGTLPLSIYLAAPTTLLGQDEANRIINVLNQYATRWQVLRCEAPVPVMEHLSNGKQDLAILDTLKLHIIDNSDYSASLNLFPPRLSVLTIVNVKISSQTLKWTSLTQLAVSGATPTDVFEALRRGFNLTNCTFQRISAMEIDQLQLQRPLLPFIHPKLKVLHMSVTLCTTVFHHFLLPS